MSTKPCFIRKESRGFGPASDLESADVIRQLQGQGDIVEPEEQALFDPGIDVARFDIELTAVRVFIIHFVYGIVISPPMPPFMGMAAQ